MMDGARWTRVKALFHAALDVVAEEREAFVRAHAGADAAVAAEVQDLLAAHDGIDQPPVAALPGSPTQIGRYRLLSVLGEGGFGTVHLAEQLEPVQRHVALKVLRAGLDSALVIQRFALEREALARMSHPNIAQIYDAGTTAAGAPFFAMEFVEGATLMAYCDEHRLDVAQRLRLFVQVCHGVHHAHQKGVIHRDLKPSNVLIATVDRVPVPKIIDFGIAKATGGFAVEPRGAVGDHATIGGKCIGTPGYMSPEQADLDGASVDVRSDVYSLGVLLYELLTGRLPHDPGTLRDGGLLRYLQRVRELDPPRPSTAATIAEIDAAKLRSTTAHQLRRRLRGDLDWITLRALERDPARRYQSADDIAEELLHHLDHEPVRAGPPGFGYRARKFVRRHHVATASGAAILLALVIGLVTTLWQNGIARAALRDAVGHRLSAQAINLAGESPTLSLLLAIEGASRAPGEDADAALYAALGNQHEVRRTLVHDLTPRRAAYSSDQRIRLSADDSRLVVCMAMANAEVLHRFDAHERPIGAVGISDDGHRGLTIDESGLGIAYDLQAGRELHRLHIPARVRDVAYAPQTDEFLVIADDGVLRRCDRDGRLADAGAFPAPLLAIAVDAAGRQAALLGDNRVSLFDLADPGTARTVQLAAPPTALAESSADASPMLAFTADGQWLVCLGPDGAIDVLNRVDAAASFRPTAAACRSFALASRRGLLAICEAAGRNFVLDLATRHRCDLPDVDHGRPMSHATLDPLGTTLVTTVHGHPTLWVWDPVLGKSLARLQGDGHALYHARISPDGRFIDALGHNGAEHRWRVDVFAEMRSLAHRVAGGEFQAVRPLPDGGVALAWRRDAGGEIRCDLVSVSTGALVSAMAVTPAAGDAAHLAPRNDAILLETAQDTVLFALPSGQRVLGCGKLLARPRCNATLARIVGRVGDRVQVFDCASRAIVREIDAPGVQYVDIDRTGDLVLTADGGHNTATVWSVATGKSVRIVEHHAFVFDARFSADGTQAITLANDTSVRVTDIRTGNRVRRLVVPTADFGWLCGDTDGRFLAAQTPEETLVYEVATGRRLLRWRPEQGGERFVHVDFTTDGKHLSAVLGDGRHRLLPLDPQAAAAALAPRTLTAVERRAYDLPEPEVQQQQPVLIGRPLIDSALDQLADRDGHGLAEVDAAERQLAVAETLRPRPLPRFHLAKALVVARRAALRGQTVSVGERDQALHDLEVYLRAGESVVPLDAMPELAALRSEPGFTDLVERHRR